MIRIDDLAVKQFLAIRLVDMETFHWIAENFDLLVALQKKPRDHKTQQTHFIKLTYLLRTMNVCKKYHPNPFNRC